jgi:hypothetical protein
MKRIPCAVAAVFAVLAAAALLAQDKKGAVTDVSKADADFAVQGEYVGDVMEDGKAVKFGVQVVARGGGKFRAFTLRGGLPGDGWDKSKKIQSDGTTADGVTKFAGLLGEALIKDGVLTITGAQGKLGELKRVLRRSPTEGAAPPEGAIVLFDGKTAEHFKGGKLTEDGLLMVGCSSKQSFKDFTLHLEFRTPYQPSAGGQGRGNSGVYLHGKWEVQVLDSFGLEGKSDECGGFYGFRKPDVNMCLPPLSWQTYDVEFACGKTDAEGKTGGPVVTVRHNGVVIHEMVELKGATNGGPFNLQNHGNPVHYRNIWLVEKK